MSKIKTVQRCAVCLRISIFIFNAFVWLGSLFAIVCGLMVGFSNGTFSLDAEEDDDYVGGEIRWRDALFTTPATLLIYYGVLMLITAIIGCFAGSGGRRCCNITFVIAIILTLLFDMIFGYFFFWTPFAMASFLKNLDKSMDSYGVNNRKTFGIIPQHPTIYWDHLQKTGSCCGKYANDEWINKTIGSEKFDFSLPDSCCTKDYAYRRCGWRVWKHMEGDMDHYRSQMLKKVGCVSIFPEEVTTKYSEISYIVIILGIFMVICGICSIVLLVLMFTKKYKAGQGPQQLPRFARTSHGPEAPPPAVPIDYSINDENDSRYQDVSFTRGGRRLSRKSEEALEGRRRRLSRKSEDALERRNSDGVSTARTRRRVHPLNPTQSEEEAHLVSDRNEIDRHRRPTLKHGTVAKHDSNTSATRDIYKNHDFGASSETEELPVVYRGRAETRLRDASLDPKSGRRLSR